MSDRRVVIVGGGVIGLSTAYHLARFGGARVTLLDKGPLGDGSSIRAAGIITGLLWSEPAVLARKISLRLFREFSRELDGYRFGEVGALNLHTQQAWPQREAVLGMYDKLGAPYEVLDGREIERRWPALRMDPSWRAIFDPLGGYSEPEQYVPALAKKVRELGVEVREHQQVSDLFMRGDRVAGVGTAAGNVEADVVVSTVHAWTNVLLAQRGLAWPVKCFVHQRFVTAPLAKAVDIPAINADPLLGYIRPASGGRMLAGYETTEREEHRVSSPTFRMSETTADTAPMKEDILRTFPALVPAVKDVQWESERVGLICFARDGEPVLGPVDAVPGLIVGCAFHSGGFAYNPVAGLLLAELAIGRKPSVDVAALSPQRFNSDATKKSLATTIRQKDAVRRRH